MIEDSTAIAAPIIAAVTWSHQDLVPATCLTLVNGSHMEMTVAVIEPGPVSAGEDLTDPEMATWAETERT